MLYTCIQMVLFYSVTYLPATPSQFSSLPPFSVISSKTGCFVRAWACNVTQNSHARGSVNRLKCHDNGHFRPGQGQCNWSSLPRFRTSTPTWPMWLPFHCYDCCETPILIWLPWGHVKLLYNLHERPIYILACPFVPFASSARNLLFWIKQIK